MTLSRQLAGPADLIREADPAIRAGFVMTVDGALHAFSACMARIRSVGGFHATRVSIAGRLTASDMGRLERACSRALVTNPMRLAIDLSRVTFVDATARAVLAHMARRGAVVTPAAASTL